MERVCDMKHNDVAWLDAIHPSQSSCLRSRLHCTCNTHHLAVFDNFGSVLIPFAQSMAAEQGCGAHLSDASADHVTIGSSSDKLPERLALLASFVIRRRWAALLHFRAWNHLACSFGGMDGDLHMLASLARYAASLLRAIAAFNVTQS